jgi:threonine dehydrogenase-like Zn-dependent dehydrogenase
MMAITVEPKEPSTAKWEEVEEPDLRQGSILVEAIAVGVCGTDVEIIEGKYGSPPPGRTRLILGHESLGRVLETDPTGSLKKGDLVVGIVRRPDPVPCPNCAVGEWDMCRNGEYTERGIKQIDGFMSERWRIESEYNFENVQEVSPIFKTLIRDPAALFCGDFFERISDAGDVDKPHDGSTPWNQRRSNR